MKPTETVFHPPFEWQRAIAETTLTLSAHDQRRERPRDISGAKKRRRRSDSTAVHEPATLRSRPSMDTSSHLDKKLAREGRQLMTSLSNEASRSKRYREFRKIIFFVTALIKRVCILTFHVSSFEEQLQKWLSSSDTPSSLSSLPSHRPPSQQAAAGSLSLSHRLQDLKTGLRTAK